HDRGQLVAHDLDQGLARGQRLQHFLADRAHLDALYQGLHHRQRDVGLEQRDAHLAGGLADVLLGQPPPAAQALDGAGETLGEGLEHAGTWYVGLRTAKYSVHLRAPSAARPTPGPPCGPPCRSGYSRDHRITITASRSWPYPDRGYSRSYN